MNRNDENGGNEPDRREYKTFEGYICERLLDDGIIVLQTGRRPERCECGNLLGIDIVYDPRMRQRGGIYIETHVMEAPPLPVFFRSTLFRDNDAWLYGIGDHELFFVFGKKALRRQITEIDKYFPLPAGAERRQTATSKGILLPFEQAETLAERTFRFGGPVSGFLNFVRPFESSRPF